MKTSEDPTVAQMEKLQFIELLAYFHGAVNREDLINRFGISKASATNVLTAYNRMAPENLRYDIRLKRYEISNVFKPVFNVRLLIERIPVYTMPKLHKPADDEVIDMIALISRAIQNTQSLIITYISTTSGTSTRQIVPVAFANNLLRWHLRAFDRKRENYVDFVFSRIRKVSLIKHDTIEHHEHPNNDQQWHSFVELKIIAHPHNFAKSQSFVIGDEIRSIRLRAAMAGYFLQLWNVDCSENASLRERKYQYMLENLAEVSEVADLALAPGYVRENLV